MGVMGPDKRDVIGIPDGESFGKLGNATRYRVGKAAVVE